MSRPRSTPILPIVLGITTASICPLGAVGYRLPNQDPEGIARGNAFAATADNPSAIYYNPAGITQLEGQNLSLGSYFISTDVHYDSFTGGSASTKTDFQAVPQIYYTYSPADSPFSYGVGIYAPYGLGIDYGNNTPFSTLAQKGKIVYATLNPVIAYEVSPTLSVAAGLTLNYSQASLQRRIGLVPVGQFDQFEFEGDGFAIGYNLGALWQPVSEWSFGLNFRSPTKVAYSGESIAQPFSTSSKTTTELDYPMNIVGGVSYRPDDKWNFEFNLDWTDWDSVNDALFVGTFGGNQVFPFRYESSFMYQFGVTRQLNDGYYLSAGYIYSENSVPDRTFTPLNPDSDLHLLSFGFGHRGERFSWAVGYHFAYNGGRVVTGNAAVSPRGETANGTYTTFNNAVNISCRYSF
jgi:long-chain fatty acid transport protein